MKILAVGDSFVPRAVFEAGLARLADRCSIRFIEMDESAWFAPTTRSERSIREYTGDPGRVAAALDGEQVLLVHGAPITAAVLDAAPSLKLVGVARSGPVNVDVAAATERGIAVIAAPGRNADAVADLTLAFAIMLARGILGGVAFVAAGGRLGESTFEGARFFGRELGGHTLGLVGYGQVGERVVQRALSFGMSTLVYDPYVPAARIERSRVAVTDRLDDLLARADFVSLHARATPENADFFDAHAFRRMKPDAFFINTARESLVDERALYDVLADGRIAGAALDVVKARPDGSPNPLLSLPNVIITPHIGGATHEAARRGVTMLADEVERWLAGEALTHVVNPAVTGGAPR